MTDDPKAKPKAKIEAEIAWSQQQLQSLERDWRRLPYIALLLLLAIPGGYFWGGLGALIAVVGTLIIGAISAYLVTGHKSEYEDKIRDLKKDLQRL